MSGALKAGGALGAGELYIERAADAELRQALAQGEFCYVLAPRQMGKTSLLRRVSRQFQDQPGMRCASVSLDTIGAAGGAEEWYFSVVVALWEALGLSGDPDEFWERQTGQTLVPRLLRFLRQVVLGQVPGQV